MRQFKNLKRMEEVNTFVNNHELSFLYISRQGCSVCHGLLPQVQTMMEHYPKIKLGHIDGKEYLREARIVQMDEFNHKVSKVYYGVLG
ncbi:thioredoxin [Tenuibacillus multivorans]|uniref:thioredoxin n=1 Tax=Tenuibacillus multivorans TaxID=237069 RepID=UPI0015A3F6D4|nr:thioredoxin [Tenuibacillus multivorans]